MGWNIREWMCGGYRADRADGETVFIYRRPDWGTGISGTRQFFELRSRGELIGRISAETSWKPLLRAEWLAEEERPLNETDLLEIVSALRF